VGDPLAKFWGVCHETIIVADGAMGTVAAPVCPGYVAAGAVPGIVSPARFAPSLLRIFTDTFAVLDPPLKT
jgi:hypothetical protein